MKKAHSLREKVVGEYKTYQLLEDHEYTYINIFGDKIVYSYPKGTICHQAINYHHGKRTHYFNRKSGWGGTQVDTIENVENNSLKYKYLGIKKYE